MLGRALTEHRLWLVAGAAMAVAFWLIPDGNLPDAAMIVLKGGSVAALSAYALASSRAREAKLIAAVMAIGAAGDVEMELDTVAGGGLFLVSHLVAITLYWFNRRTTPSASQRMAAAALFIGTPLAAWLLAKDPLAVIYAVALGAMAASAWLSRFSRYHVGVGALLFVASDLLIFARLGQVLGDDVTGWLVWPLYYAGQLLICTGVVVGLRRDQA